MRRTTYDAREEALGADVMRGGGASCCRSSTASGASTSTRWTTLEGIGLPERHGQRRPLVEYQREGYNMFAAMMDAIKEESVGYVFNLEVQVEGAGRRGVSTTPRSSPRLDAQRRQRSAVHRADRRRRRVSRALRRRSSRAPDDPYGDVPRKGVPVQLGEEVQALPRRPAQQVSRRR